MWCLTCAFSPNDENNADEEHMAHDGAHYPNWIVDDVTADNAERERLAHELNVAYGDEEFIILPGDLVLTDEGWTIDGMDPWEWCEAMTMD